jgi:hypothetical protein
MIMIMIKIIKNLQYLLADETFADFMKEREFCGDL